MASRNEGSLKIAIVLYDRAEYRAGPIVNARRLLPELRKRGHDIVAFVLVGGRSAPNAAKLAREGVEVYKRRMPKYTELGISWLLEMVSETQPDVFVANSYVPAWFSARWVRESGVSTIAAFRNDDEFHWEMAREFVFGDRRWATSAVVCVSDYLGDLVKQKSPKFSSVAVIPSGVSIPESIASRDEREPLRIVYVGRLIQKQKRIRDTVDSLIRALNILPGATVTLIGQDYGDEKQGLVKKVEENKLGNRISFIGVVDPEDIQKHLVGYHVIVLLSDYEGTPGAIMDAMACGVVPVCLNIPGGTSELVLNRETGLVVENRHDAFVDAIAELDGDIDLLTRLSRNARKRIEAYYSLESAADAWEALCARLIESEKPRRPIEKPKSYDLPAVRPGLAESDRRIPRHRRLFGSMLPVSMR